MSDRPLADPASAPLSGPADPQQNFSRRQVLRGGVLAAGAAALPFEVLAASGAPLRRSAFNADYGPLAPVADESTGLALLQLPAGFRYLSYGWTGDVMTDGVPTPAAHDGMSVCWVDGYRVVLVRNHEQSGSLQSFAPSAVTFDPRAEGGTTTLTFNTRVGEWKNCHASLSGTVRNCAGGPTPWNSWLTCEETSVGPHTVVNGERPFVRQHGYVFEVPAKGKARPQPLTGLGAFSHEACAVDPATGIVYETEDSTPSGFYRFVPNVFGQLRSGGSLQMMKLVAAPNASIVIEGVLCSYFNTGNSFPVGTQWNVTWVPIAEPTRMFTSGTNYGGVRFQGLSQGASSIVRGEGCWYGNGKIYVCSTSGGASGNGQIFAYDPVASTLTLIYESTGSGALDNPDNIAWSPRGSLILCENGNNTPQYLRGLTLGGEVFPFCANNVNFLGSYVRPSGRVFSGNYRDTEFAGASFHDQWLFFNIQTPGITFAVTGPWANGPL